MVLTLGVVSDPDVDVPSSGVFVVVVEVVTIVVTEVVDDVKGSVESRTDDEDAAPVVVEVKGRVESCTEEDVALVVVSLVTTIADVVLETTEDVVGTSIEVVRVVLTWPLVVVQPSHSALFSFATPSGFASDRARIAVAMATVRKCILNKLNLLSNICLRYDS